MKHTNKNEFHMEESEFDALLRQTFDCSQKPPQDQKDRLIKKMQMQSTHKQRTISLWWLPAVTSILLTLALFVILPCFIASSLFLSVFLFVTTISCVNTCLLTLVALKLFHLKEACSI